MMRNLSLNTILLVLLLLGHPSGVQAQGHTAQVSLLQGTARLQHSGVLLSTAGQVVPWGTHGRLQTGPVTRAAVRYSELPEGVELGSHGWLELSQDPKRWYTLRQGRADFRARHASDEQVRVSLPHGSLAFTRGSVRVLVDFAQSLIWVQEGSVTIWEEKLTELARTSQDLGSETAWGLVPDGHLVVLMHQRAPSKPIRVTPELRRALQERDEFPDKDMLRWLGQPPPYPQGTPALSLDPLQQRQEQVVFEVLRRRELQEARERYAP